MLNLKNITKIYKTSSFEQKALDDVSISFKNNEFVFILGESGSGKTTLLNIIGGLDNSYEGDLIINGKSTKNFKNEDFDSYRNNLLGLVFQNYNLIDYLTPIENVRLVNKKASEDILLQLGLDKSQINRNVMKLSGGQQQRVAIARALASEAPIILADEPTGNLDSDTAGEIIEILKRLAKERNKCVIVVTHSKEVANSADIILELSDKKLRKISKIN